MPANASSQTTTHSGADKSDTQSERHNVQRQTGEQHSIVIQDQNRNGHEIRKTESDHDEETSNHRQSDTLATTEHEQKVSGTTTQEQTTTESSTSEHPLILKRSTESGGGTTQTSAEDLCMQVEWEIEIAGGLIG